MFLVASADICSLEPSSLSLWTSSSSDRQSPKQPRKQPNKRARKLTYMQTSLHTCLHACTPTYIHVRSSIQCANARMSRHSIYITTCVLLRVHKCLSCPRLSASLFFCFLRRNPLKRFRGPLLLVFCDCVLFAFVVFHFSFVSCGFLFFWCWCLRFLPLPSSCLIGIFLAKPPHKAISCGFFFFSSVTAFCLSLLFFPFSFLSCSFFFF